MIVYRGEQIREPLSGRPCGSGGYHWWRMPTPTDDGLPSMNTTDWCAATSKKAIFKWWHPSNHHKMVSVDMKIFVLDIPKEFVKRGRTQCLIDRREAKRVGELLPTGKIVWKPGYLAKKGNNTNSRQSSTTNVVGSSA